MSSIFQVAQHWKLDIMKLANNTRQVPKYKLSQQVSKGNIPNFLRREAPITTTDVQFCMFYKTEKPKYIGRGTERVLDRKVWLHRKKPNARPAKSTLEPTHQAKKAKTSTNQRMTSDITMSEDFSSDAPLLPSFNDKLSSLARQPPRSPQFIGGSGTPTLSHFFSSDNPSLAYFMDVPSQDEKIDEQFFEKKI